MGVTTCDDLQKWSLTKLQQEFGPKTGQTLYKRCRGKDNRAVQLQKERKSVSAEINYGIRFEKVNIFLSIHYIQYIITFILLISFNILFVVKKCIAFWEILDFESFF